MARKEPTPSTVKRLFAFSGNQCAYEGCDNSLIDDNILIGEICHIEAAEKGGKRFNKNSDDEQRRDFSNLILMCPICHKKIDSDEIKYSVLLLKNWKKTHEDKFELKDFQISKSILERTLQKLMKQKTTNDGNGIQFNNLGNTINVKEQIGTKIINISQPDKTKKIMQDIRAVISEFKEIIDDIKREASPPKKTVIDFRNELVEKYERNIELIPHKHLKFRKDNGRIRAEVESYERQHGQLDETDAGCQEILRNFLGKSDNEKKKVLKQQIRHKGQQQPAIITCDGFLINGNRRKMVLEELYAETNEDPRFESLRVVVLPENVSELDIQKIENRYQLQDEGKAEYHKLNQALTIRKNEQMGYSLEAQLRDDPKNADKSESEFRNIVNGYKRDYLYPLDFVDKYLRCFKNDGKYELVSEGIADREGRWQAFIDLSIFYHGTFMNERKRRTLSLSTTDWGKIEYAAFVLIRKRKFHNFGKLHNIIRDLKKYVSEENSKEYILNIAKEVKTDIPPEAKIRKTDHGEITGKELDNKWAEHYHHEIISNLQQAVKSYEIKSSKDKPIQLMEDALRKLEHDNIVIEFLSDEDCKDALYVLSKIHNKVEELKKNIDNHRYKLKKGTDKLTNKYRG